MSENQEPGFVHINADNLQQHAHDLIALFEAFLVDIGLKGSRPFEKNYATLEQMVTPGSPTLLVLAIQGDKAIGLCLGNTGIGYASGGSYLWINGIYIDPAYQHKGHGKKLLAYVEEIARSQNCLYIFCVRDQENEASEKLFKSSSFTQEPDIWMSKKL